MRPSSFGAALRPGQVNSLAILVGLVALAGCAGTDPRTGNTVAPGDLVVVSQNVHYLAPGRDETNWEGRRDALTAALIDLNPDVILFQEMETFTGPSEASANVQRDWVLATVPGYAAGANAPDATKFPITQPIFYRTSRFILVDQGWFFFSPTPDQIYARTWTDSWPSFTSWVVLEEKTTGRRLAVYNTHPEAFSEENQRRGMELLAQRVAPTLAQGIPVIVGGDFNQFGNDPKLRPLENLGLVRAPADGPSFHFQKGWHLYPAIDHLFASPELQWQWGGAVPRQWKGAWPSDHHPVIAVYRR